MTDNFCSLPWVNLSTDVNGSLRPCCKFAQPNPSNEYQLPNMKDGNLDELWNDIKFQNLRQAFIDGKKPKECQSCWDEENAGIPSFRTQFCIDKKINLTNFSYGKIATKGPQALDLKLNNVCNLKCRICGPQASSTFLKEHEERFKINIEDGAYWLSNKILGTQNENVINQWAGELKHIEITGGEPMVSPENIKILQLIITSGNAKNITMLMNTNATQYNNKLLDLMVKFKKITLCLSIDDLGKRLEYARYPTDWEIVQKNLEKFIGLSKLHYNLEIILCPTVSKFNIYFLDEYIKWYKKLGLWAYFNILHYDPSQCIKNLPIELKNILNKKLTDSVLAPVINFLNLPQDGNYMKKFIEDIESFDKIRNQNFINTFDDWGNLIYEYKKW